ncbi:unnamed protein product [Darwinula stevensoni]|uniref:Rab-like protein 6 n=1 Tax=Darwinula stevensoni TaxID=69355 RepID=A0A7R8X763_9CRUS|nr:unnamed protein product [Darwinula stevensoni]CAG0880160.1 unnamed protein product [Darwinula stevensoni]
MLSVLKKLKARGEPGSPSPGEKRMQNVTAMPSSLQKKFSKGVQYNMKIVIRGDRNVGKTCLYKRLQGQQFQEEYVPTDEIQVTCIQWNFKNTEEIIKVDVWDVVDEGKVKKDPNVPVKLKMAHDKPSDDGFIQQPVLDASFLDVYKDAHGVIMMFDMTKNWTFHYVERELRKVPKHIPVLLLGNHRDMAHHRTVTDLQVTGLLEDLLQEDQERVIHYTEASMRNGFGLKFLHKFLSLPFLLLQRETLTRQLERNKEDIDIAIQELDLCLLNEANSRFEEPRQRSPGTSHNVGVSSPESDEGISSSSNHATPGSPVIKSSSPEENTVNSESIYFIALSSFSNHTISREFPTQTATVGDFVPEEECSLEKQNSLDDHSQHSSTPQQLPQSLECESDGEGSDEVNPMVAGFQDDLDPEDFHYTSPGTQHAGASDSD